MIRRRTLLLGALAAAVAGPTSARSESRARLWRDGDPGQRLFLRGRVLGSAGRPLAAAAVHVRQADGSGQYHPDRYQASLLTAEDGAFALNTALPGQYYGEKHIHVLVEHPDHAPLSTEILFLGDPNLVSDEYGGYVVVLEEVRRDGQTVLVGGVELKMESLTQ